MVEDKKQAKSCYDCLSDCALAIVQEAAFWVDVFQTTMQWDEESIRRNA